MSPLQSPLFLLEMLPKLISRALWGDRKESQGGDSNIPTFLTICTALPYYFYESHDSYLEGQTMSYVYLPFMLFHIKYKTKKVDSLLKQNCGREQFWVTIRNEAISLYIKTFLFVFKDTLQ